MKAGDGSVDEYFPYQVDFKSFINSTRFMMRLLA